STSLNDVRVRHDGGFLVGVVAGAWAGVAGDQFEDGDAGAGSVVVRERSRRSERGRVGADRGYLDGFFVGETGIDDNEERLRGRAGVNVPRILPDHFWRRR